MTMIFSSIYMQVKVMTVTSFINPSLALPMSQQELGEDAWERWKSAVFTPDLVQFEAEDESLHDQHDQQPLQYVGQ